MFERERERKDYEDLENIATEKEFLVSNIAVIADELTSLGFWVSVTSEDGKDKSDLLLTVKRRS